LPDISNSRDDVLALLRGERCGRVPCFSGLISVTADGLRELGYAFSEVHHDSIKLAAAAASTPRLTGFESAVLPLDLCVEAEVLGANVDFRSSAPRAEYPIVNRPVAASIADLRLNVPADGCRRRGGAGAVYAVDVDHAAGIGLHRIDASACESDQSVG
jgi:[methyl-Co(III) methanol-specific corrinoid protein]:coenzyme M methyltransferase